MSLSRDVLNEGNANNFLEHHPSKGITENSAAQRKYLLSLDPYQSKLATFPTNTNIPHEKQHQFCSL